MAYRVLISAPYMIPVIDQFRPVFDAEGIELVIPHVEERLEEDELLAVMSDIHGVISGDDRFTEKVLRNSPALKVISKWGTGIDSINQEIAAELGIAICNTPNAFSEPVADSVLGYALAFARQLFTMTEDIRNGQWHKPGCVALNDCTFGVIGVGDVGKAVVRRLVGFNPRILVSDIVELTEELIQETGIEVVDKETLLRESDFVSLNCDLNPTSYHIISHAEFQMMKPTAYLINAARGPLIDEPALVQALQTNEIAGTALDVFEEEPLPASSPLREMSNVFLAPHNSNSSPKAYAHVHQNTIQNLLTVLREHGGDR